MGSLTGTRVAGVIGKAVVAYALIEAVRSPAVVPYRVGEGRLFFSAWIDNLYFCRTSAQQATQNLDVLEEILSRTWRLRFKPSSLITTSACSQVDAGWGVSRYAWKQVFQFWAIISRTMAVHGRKWRLRRKPVGVASFLAQAVDHRGACRWLCDFKTWTERADQHGRSAAAGGR